MNFVRGLPVASMSALVTRYFLSSLMRSPHFSAGSPIETQTSVWRKSQPATPFFGSSVSRIFAPESAASSLARATTGSAGHRDFGAQRRTSMPIRAPTSSSELPMLLRASPR